MASAPARITLSRSRDIPFNQLTLSQANVRRTRAGVSIEELAEDIARRGLLQSLNVRPILDADGAETGRFEVPAGGRRYRALERLVSQKRLARNAPVPCVVRDAGSAILAEDDSLAENLQRAPLHPLDQFRAFQALRDKGQSEEDIAAAFFTTAQTVRQRLRLAAVSGALLEVYAADGMTLEQLMAFTVTQDTARQEQVWAMVQTAWSREPHHIRRLLTQAAVRTGDRRVRFVGLEAYEAAGGRVLRDLFSEDHGGWVEDTGLLDTLVMEKLNTRAEELAAEGWSWVAAAPDFPYGHTAGMRQVAPLPTSLSPGEQAQIEILETELREIEDAHGGDDVLPEPVAARAGEIEARLDALAQPTPQFDPADKARAGVFVSLAADGRIRLEPGYIRLQDEAASPVLGGDGVAGIDVPPPAQRPEQRAGTGPIAVEGSAPPMPDEDEDAVMRPLPERLVLELSAHRTLALRDALAVHPDVALTALLHRWVGEAFLRIPVGGACLEAQVRSVSFAVQGEELKDSACARSIAARHEAWRARLPQDEQALWDWLAGLDQADRLALLAHCVSLGVNAVQDRSGPQGGAGVPRQIAERRMREAGRLAQAIGLDMGAAGWRVSVPNYLGRVPRQRILEAVREGAGETAASLIAHLKKADMAREAERLLAETGWLPEPLRTPDALEAACADAPGPAASALRGLPAFLSEGEDAGDGIADAPCEA